MNYGSPVNGNGVTNENAGIPATPQMQMNPQMMQMNPQMMQMNPQMMQMNPQMMMNPQFNPQMMQMNPQMMQMNPQMMQMGMGMNMNPADMYNSYNPYMSQPQYEFNPYLNSMQYGQTNYPYMPMSPMYNNGHIPAKNGKRKHYKSTSTTPRSSSFKSNEDSPSTTEITDQWDGDKVEKLEETDQTDFQDSSLPSESTPQPEQSSPQTPKPEESNLKEEPTSKEEPASASALIPESIILKNLPLYVNTDYEDFTEDKDSFHRRKQAFDTINGQLEDRDLIIKHSQQEIINYDNVKPSMAPEETGPKNWASVLTSSAKPKPKAKVQSLTPLTPLAQPLTVLTPQPIATPLPAVEEIDSVGLLSLKKMFNLLGDSAINDVHFKVTSRGLTNTGNICYMNSILQVLMYCEPFNNLFRIIDLKSVGSLNAAKNPLVDATIGLFRDFSQQSLKSLSPESFYMKLVDNPKFSHLKWGQQEDAEEFLGYYLDGLHEEFIKCINDINKEQLDLLLKKVNPIDTETRLQLKSAIRIIKKLNNNGETKGETDPEDDNDETEPNDNDGWNEIGSKNQKVSSKRTVEIEPSPIKTIFGGQFRSVLQIPHKKDQSITLDPFQCIQLDISNEEVNTIEEAFKQLNEPEQIPFKLNDNREVMAKKQTFIDNLPPVLVIHLKRFSYDHANNGNIEKLKKKITFGHQLTIPSELFSNWKKHINKDYKLTGVVYHHGTGAEGGHYTCDVLRPTKVSNIKMNKKHTEEDQDTKPEAGEEWIRIDDTMINEINTKEALNGDDDIKNAYILFYQKL